MNVRAFDVPPEELTVTLTTVVGVPGGTVTVIAVGPVIVKVAVVPPNVTLVAAARFVPCKMTCVPAVAAVGVIDVRVGAPT